MGISEKNNEAHVGAEPMMYLMQTVHGDITSWRLQRNSILKAFFFQYQNLIRFLERICYLSHDEVIVDESQPETDSGGGSISIAAGWYSPNFDNIFKVEEIFNSILKNN